MKTNTLNRTVLSALMGSALAFGWGAPATAQAQDLQGRSGRGQVADSGSDDDAAARRDARQARKAQENADAPRAAPQVQARQRDEHPRDEQPRQAQEQRQRDWNREVPAIRQPEFVRNDPPRQDREPAPAYREQRPRQETVRNDEPRRTDNQAADPWQVLGTPRREHDNPVPRTDIPRSGRSDDERRTSGYQRPDRDQQIDEQRRQAEAFAHQRDQRRHEADRWSRNLQSQHRTSGYRYQQDYWSRLSRQRYDWQNYDYYSDPYFYSAPSYRYYRGGNSYYINNYAADLLRQAINYGYREGIRAGQADRYDGWRFSYRDAYAYQDASYGYRGMYVDYSEYSYYFREGFRRGYEDGYYDNRRYGRYYNGSDNVLQTVLSLILDLRPYR